MTKKVVDVFKKIFAKYNKMVPGSSKQPDVHLTERELIKTTNLSRIAQLNLVLAAKRAKTRLFF